MWFHNKHPVTNQRTTSSAEETDLTHSIHRTMAKFIQRTWKSAWVYMTALILNFDSPLPTNSSGDNPPPPILAAEAQGGDSLAACHTAGYAKTGLQRQEVPSITAAHKGG